MKKLLLVLACVFMLCGCSSKREAKSYQDVVDTFKEYGYKVEKVSVISDFGILEFKLNDEPFSMFFEYDEASNKATADELFYPAGESKNAAVYKNIELTDNTGFNYEDIDSKIKARLDKSLKKMDVTYEEFSDWCKKIIEKTDFSKYTGANLTGIDYLKFVFGKDMEVKDAGSAGVMIKDKEYIILVGTEHVYAMPRTYDFAAGSGYMYIPEGNVGGYNNKGVNGVYNFENGQIIEGTLTEADITELTKLKNWYDEKIKYYGVTTEELKK